jgi:hypothetical protein
MPLYRAGPEGVLYQSFVDRDRPEFVIRLISAEQDLKRRMFAAYRTQSSVLANFTVDVERFRLAADYDFAAPANAGGVHYESQNWGVKLADWFADVAKAERALAALRADGGFEAR